MRTLLPVVLLLVGALAAATPAQAQTAQPSGDLDAKDAEGDVGVFGGGLPAGPSLPVAPYLDLLDLHVFAETEEGVKVAIQVKDFKEPQGSEIFGTSYFVSFRSDTNPP